MGMSKANYHESEVTACFLELQQLRKDIDTIIQGRIKSLIGIEAIVGAGDAETVEICAVNCDVEHTTHTPSCGSDPTRTGTKSIPVKYQSRGDAMPQKACLSHSFSEAELLRKVDAVQTSDSNIRLWLQAQLAKETSQNVVGSILSFTRAVVANPMFDFCFGSLVLLSAIVVGLQVEFANIQSTHKLFEHITDGLSFAFFVELVFRVSAKGSSFFKCGKEMTWNYLDSMFVAISMVQFAYKQLSGGESLVQSGKAGFMVFRLARLVRLMKLVRVIRVVRFFRALRILVHSIGSTIKSLIWAIMLLTLIIYLFAIILTQAVHEHFATLAPEQSLSTFDTDLVKYFGSIPRSVFTLYKCITGGMSWEIAATLLGELHAAYLIVFLVYVTFAMLAVLNVITGFFCQSAIEHAESDEEEVIQTQLKSIDEWRSKLEQIFHQIDEFDSGRFTLQQFEAYCDNERVHGYFEALGLDVSDAWRIFSMLDTDESNTICIGEFVNGCLQMRGAASKIEVREVLVRNRWMMDQMESLLQMVNTVLDDKKRGDSLSTGLLASLRGCALQPFRDRKSSSVSDLAPLHMSL